VLKALEANPDDSELLGLQKPHVIRSVCRAMGLPPGIFELDPKEDFGIDDEDDDE
jgi:hypothetical protein